MSIFEQTLRQAGVDTAAGQIGLDFSLFTQPGMAAAYGDHVWIITHHPQIGAVINAVPAIDRTDTVPWEEWFRLDGALHHHVLYSVQKAESTETWKGPLDDQLHPPQVLGRPWHVHNDSNSQPVLLRKITKVP